MPVKGQCRPQPRQSTALRHLLFKILSRKAASPATPEEALVCPAAPSKTTPCLARASRRDSEHFLRVLPVVEFCSVNSKVALGRD